MNVQDCTLVVQTQLPGFKSKMATDHVENARATDDPGQFASREN